MVPEPTLAAVVMDALEVIGLSAAAVIAVVVVARSGPARALMCRMDRHAPQGSAWLEGEGLPRSRCVDCGATIGVMSDYEARYASCPRWRRIK